MKRAGRIVCTETEALALLDWFADNATTNLNVGDVGLSWFYNRVAVEQIEGKYLRLRILDDGTTVVAQRHYFTGIIKENA